MMQRIKLSISLVIYREAFSDIQPCLESLFSAIPHEINTTLVIIDNGSNELVAHSEIEAHCLRHYPFYPIRYISASRNGGYGYGHNLAIFSSDADYHLVMNSDVCVMPDALKNALDFMQINPQIGMLVPDIYDSKGDRVYLCRQNPKLWISFLRRFAPTWLKKCFVNQLEKFEMRNKAYDEPIFNLTNPTGCFMFCRLPILKSIKGFDEKFFLYYEDADLGYRFTKVSQIAYVPSVKIRHEWRRAAYHDKRLAWIAIKSALYYAWKWR